MTAGAGTGTDLTALSARLWAAVIDRDESAAVRMVTAAADAGADEEALLLDVVAGVQHRVGAEWAADRISVAEEHAASAITDRIVAALAHRRPVPSGPHERGRITVACVAGEWHFLPARLLAEVLVRRGWRVDFLGAHTPTPRLVAHVHRANPVAVLLSASIPTHLPAAHRAVTAVQSLGVPVMVGGAAFGPDGRYASLIQADGWAPDARTAADRLARGVIPPRTDRRHRIHDLSHLADQEYTLVKGSRTTLVRSCVADLGERRPAMRYHTPARRERTAESLAHIVDFLATALYVDDADLFTTFTAWSAGILTARRVPAHSLRLGLEVLAERLHDFPRALAFLRTALDALPATPARRERR
ncbi:B12-binding domain-containing protein [Streptomyces sp. NBC_00199]|uniref:cobalamin B12-binding domain-containing protein n=1 Tax=Streptomyces sp. NBC_00199 TaxID=2975678 RepID=UPI00224E2A81|nr:cobalamin-dependent protein [Streptomyces sp. NBC_00199]MCX5264606.1 cobalamin-dependent protein [Streptomyces sp. NBC_00199]